MLTYFLTMFITSRCVSFSLDLIEHLEFSDKEARSVSTHTAKKKSAPTRRGAANARNLVSLRTSLFDRKAQAKNIVSGLFLSQF